MDYKIVLSDLFIADLEEITAYLIRQAGPGVASRIGNELLDKTLALANNPFIGQPVKRRPGARKVLRYAYCIYYDVNEEQRIHDPPSLFRFAG